MKNKISDLRNHLFATLEALQDKDNPMPIDRAKAIAEVGQTIINSAKVEVEFLEVTGAKGFGTGFLQVQSATDETPAQNVPALPRLVK